MMILDFVEALFSVNTTSCLINSYQVQDTDLGLTPWVSQDLFINGSSHFLQISTKMPIYHNFTLVAMRNAGRNGKYAMIPLSVEICGFEEIMFRNGSNIMTTHQVFNMSGETQVLYNLSEIFTSNSSFCRVDTFQMQAFDEFGEILNQKTVWLDKNSHLIKLNTSQGVEPIYLRVYAFSQGLSFKNFNFSIEICGWEKVKNRTTQEKAILQRTFLVQKN